MPLLTITHTFIREGFNVGTYQLDEDAIAPCPYPLRSEAAEEWIAGYDAGLFGLTWEEVLAA